MHDVLRDNIELNHRLNLEESFKHDLITNLSKLREQFDQKSYQHSMLENRVRIQSKEIQNSNEENSILKLDLNRTRKMRNRFENLWNNEKKMSDAFRIEIAELREQVSNKFEINYYYCA